MIQAIIKDVAQAQENLGTQQALPHQQFGFPAAFVPVKIVKSDAGLHLVRIGIGRLRQ